VSGSDKINFREVERLQRLGLQFFQQHRAEDAADAGIDRLSSAIKPDNPTLVSARQSERERLPARGSARRIMQESAESYLRHDGKTTTSAMTAHVLRERRFAPVALRRRRIPPILGQNAHWDSRVNFCGRRDESDGTIVVFIPNISWF